MEYKYENIKIIIVNGEGKWLISSFVMKFRGVDLSLHNSDPLGNVKNQVR